MANPNLPGERSATPPEETEPSWRPQDPDLPDERGRPGDDDDESGGGGELRDARRWDSDEPYRSAERAGDRPGAGRYGEERLRELQRGPRRDERSQWGGGDPDWRPSAGSFEDRYRELGADAGIGSWPDHTGSDPWRYASQSQSAYRGRDFEPERHGLSGGHDPRTGHAGGRPRRGDERLGEPAGSYSRPGAWDAADATSSASREVHVHRGTGPHRGKGPAGYQRSDERIRELVCESLTDDDEIDASHIEVGVSHGEVTLSGTVEDRRIKRAAEDCAYSVSGVRDVQNRLRVHDDRASRSNPSGAAAVDPHETQSSAQGSKPRG
ncbi:MAG TPA: BON domain-containing protein [Kofleriaceae bacterium]